MNIKIYTSETSITVHAPYNTIFIAAAKRLGGKWVTPNWVFDIRDEGRVRELCMQIYGSDGRVQDLCTVRAELDSSSKNYAGPIEIAGRTVARAYGRDSGAKLGEGIVLLKGGFDSGGSVKNWKTITKDGTVVLVRDFPRAIAQKMIEDGATWLSIEPEAPVINHDTLRAERTRLFARIAEIDEILKDKEA